MLPNWVITSFLHSLSCSNFYQTYSHILLQNSWWQSSSWLQDLPGSGVIISLGAWLVKFSWPMLVSNDLHLNSTLILYFNIHSCSHIFALMIIGSSETEIINENTSDYDISLILYKYFSAFPNSTCLFDFTDTCSFLHSVRWLPPPYLPSYSCHLCLKHSDKR